MKIDRRFVLLLSCFFLSGLAGLIYQTAWTRQFALVFGTSELALVTVLAAYMAGLALGAAAAGRWAWRLRRPVVAYAVLELGIGGAALAVPAAIGLASRLQVALLGGAETPPAAASADRAKDWDAPRRGGRSSTGGGRGVTVGLDEASSGRMW